MRSKLAISDSDADKLAREQTKNKLLNQCIENRSKFNYQAPITSVNKVNKLYNKIQGLNEHDQLAVMRTEIKLKKIVYSDLPNDCILFKQHNIRAKQMYQNLLALHSVDACNQEIISVEDIYAITDSMESLSLKKQSKRSKVLSAPSSDLVGDFQ